MSVENLDNHQPLPGHSRKRTEDGSSINKKSILFNKSFLIDILDKIVSSKVEKLINAYGGKILQMPEKNANYLISDKINDNNDTESSSKKVAESMSLPCSKRKNSNDLITKANLLNIQILSPKQFQHWLKSLLKKVRTPKKPADKVASVLRGKVSLKIESLDQGQCPVFEFIPKWPDLGDTLCKKKIKIPNQNFCCEDYSNDEYNSSDQYSTSEIGGMCELCDMPFMNYKEHINTKKHLRESQDEKKFHELDELINERPLNVIFNQFTPDNYKSPEEKNCILETSNSKDRIENTVISVIDINPGSDQKICVPCSFCDNNTVVLKEHTSTSLKRKCCSDTNITFVPQKRPSYLRSPSQTDTNIDKKIKRKRKKHKNLSSKDIYKVEVVNTKFSSSKNNKVHVDKPPVIIRLKRVKRSKKEISIGEAESCLSKNNSIKYNKTVKRANSDQRKIRVVRKPSVVYEPKRMSSSSKGISQNLFYSFEQPEIFECNHKDVNYYYPTNRFLPNTRSSIEHIQAKYLLDKCKTNCNMSLEECITTLSNLKSKKVGQWFYNVPNKIQDDLSFDSSLLTPFTDSSTKTSIKMSADCSTTVSFDSLCSSSTSSNSM